MNIIVATYDDITFPMSQIFPAIYDIFTQKFTVIWFLHLQNIESGDGFHVDFSK